MGAVVFGGDVRGRQNIMNVDYFNDDLQLKFIIVINKYTKYCMDNEQHLIILNELDIKSTKIVSRLSIDL